MCGERIGRRDARVNVPRFAEFRSEQEQTTDSRILLCELDGVAGKQQSSNLASVILCDHLFVRDLKSAGDEILLKDDEVCTAGSSR